jgi:hypothetical protein
MIPSSDRFDQSTIAALLEVDPLVADYRAFFSLFDWSVVERWQAERSAYCGSHGHPLTAYLKAFLLRIKAGLRYSSQLRQFLLEHPLLIIDFGFHLQLDPSAPYGFDADKTLPCRYWLGEKLRQLDRALLQDLLSATVAALQQEIPGLGETVAFDVKHIYAWVKENNERVYVKDRYDKTKRLAGDPDCRLGVKKRSNQEPAAAGSTTEDLASTAASGHKEQPPGATEPREPAQQAPKKDKQAPKKDKKEKKELIWGYGTGVAAAFVPEYGDVVLAEDTQGFNENDITHFHPLYQQTVVALGHFPTYLTGDAAFDAWHVHEVAVRHGGIAAVPLNQHGHPVYQRDADGVPLCPVGLRMQPTYQFEHTRGYRAQRFRCPLLFPNKTGATCEHEQFAKGPGCVKDVNWERGGQARVTLDRDGPLYHAIYTQRTSAERINSQAKELGIERPKVRNARSVANLNTLIYLIINVRALKQAKSINRGLLQMN